MKFKCDECKKLIHNDDTGDWVCEEDEYVSINGKMKYLGSRCVYSWKTKDCFTKVKK